MNQKINLVVFIREYPLGTDTKRTHHLLEPLLNKNDVSIKVLSFRSGEKISNENGLYEGIAYERIYSGLTIKISKLISVIAYFINGFRVIKAAKRKSSKNIVYCYNGLNIENLTFILYSKAIGYKVIFDIVEDYSLYRDNVKLISKFKFWTEKKLDNLSTKLGDGIIVISNYLLQKYKTKNVKNLTLISITAKLNQNQVKKNSFNKPFTVAYAGSYADKDGVDFIVNGFKVFNQKYSDSKLYLIGAGFQQKKYRQKYEKEESIIFTGYLDDKDYYALLRNVDVLCMCRIDSKFANAGFPFKLGEYLATGNPVIATKVSDVDLFLSNDSAYLIDPENLNQFINALTEIRNNPDVAFKKGENGQKVCYNSFSPEKNGEKLYDLLLMV